LPKNVPTDRSGGREKKNGPAGPRKEPIRWIGTCRKTKKRRPISVTGTEKSVTIPTVKVKRGVRNLKNRHLTQPD